MRGEDKKVKPPPTPMSRTATLDDPMTTQLLAEVARAAQTLELDPNAVDVLFDDEITAENTHPHLRKRG
jgi:hypothetical protein